MNHNEIVQNLQCIIDLSLFDANTGESSSKLCLGEKSRNEVEACENAIKLLDGAPESELTMSLDGISNILTEMRDSFEKHIAGIGEHANSTMDLERDNADALTAVLNVIENGNKELNEPEI